MFQDPTVSNVSNCLKYSKMEAVDYDDRLFVRRIQKYRECHIGILTFKRVLQSKWAVMGKIKIKIKTIGTGIPSTKKKKERKKGDIEDERDEKGFLDSNYSNDLTKDKTIGKDGVIVIDSEMTPDESTNDEVNVNEGMEVAETREAEGNAFKDLLKRESNVSEQEDKPTTDIKDVAEGEDVTGDMEVFEADAAK